MSAQSGGGSGGRRKPNAVTPAERVQLHSVWGVISRASLIEAGLSSSAIDRWCAAGRLHRLHRGVYGLVPAAALTPQGRERAAVLASGKGAVLFAVSAAVRWGMLRYPPPQPQVLRRSTGHRALRGIDLHVVHELPDSDTTVHERVPITTVERTVLDLAATASVTDRALESAAAQAERDGRFRRAAQLRVASRARDRAGSERLRRILRVGPRLWRSDEEAKAAIALVDAGLPEPVIAYRVDTDIGDVEVDLSFPAWRLILEVDGGQHALTLNAARDVDRDAALARDGWTTVRVAAAAVREDVSGVVRTVRVALVACGWSSDVR